MSASLLPTPEAGALKLRVQSTLREILTRGIHRSSCLKRLRDRWTAAIILASQRDTSKTAHRRRRESRIPRDYKTSRHLAKLETEHRAIASPSGRDRRYWHVASLRVSELRGPRLSLVSLTLSGANFSIFASPLSPSREKVEGETSSFDINLSDRWGPRRERNSWAELISGELRLRERESERNVSNNLKRFNRKTRYSRVWPPRLSIALDSATLLADTVFYEGPVTPCSRPYHLRRPRYKSPHPIPSSPHFAAFCG